MTQARGTHGRFPTTRWSLVGAVSDRVGASGGVALEQFCELYWVPVYAFIRRTGRSPEIAADLTQDFFTAIIEKPFLKQVREDRGHFRSFLIGALRHFMANGHRRAGRLRRGGHLRSEPLQEGNDRGDVPYALVDTCTPEDVFDAHWAASMFATAVDRLEQRHQNGWMRGSRFFEPLVRLVLDGRDQSFSALAAHLQTSEGSLRVQAHRVRRQFAACLQEVVRETVGSSGEVDAELRYLCAVVGRREQAPWLEAWLQRRAATSAASRTLARKSRASLNEVRRSAPSRAR